MKRFCLLKDPEQLTLPVNQSKNLSSITIPNSVTDIGLSAFRNVPEEGELNCSDEWYNSLTQYYIENLGNVYNWRKSDEPITPTEGDSIYWIGDEEYRFSVADSGGVFYGGISGDATKIKFGNSVNSISKWAEFGHNYPNLSSITMSDSMTEIIDNLRLDLSSENSINVFTL